MDIKKRNRNAGVHPAYDKLKMSKSAILKKRRRDKAANAKPAAKKHRAELNKANRKSGKVGDGMDMGHTKKGGLVKVKASINRAANGQGKRSKFHA